MAKFLSVILGITALLALASGCGNAGDDVEERRVYERLKRLLEPVGDDFDRFDSIDVEVAAGHIFGPYAIPVKPLTPAWTDWLRTFYAALSDPEMEPNNMLPPDMHRDVFMIKLNETEGGVYIKVFDDRRHVRIHFSSGGKDEPVRAAGGYRLAHPLPPIPDFPQHDRRIPWDELVKPE